MFSKFAVVAPLLMLSEGIIEIPLTRVSNTGLNSYSLANLPDSLPDGTMELGGGPYSVHHGYVAEITIDGQIYKLLCDTGSSDLLVVSNKCKTYPSGYCDAVPPAHGECINSLTKVNGGAYTGKSSSNCYGVKGFHTFAHYEIYKANVTIGGAKANNQYLGYISKQSENIWGKGPEALDGILGLAFESFSNIHKVSKGASQTLITTISNDNGIRNAFAMCFHSSGEGGKMVIGGGELQNMQYTPIIEDNYYTVKMTSISIGGQVLKNTAGLKTIVDTGSTDFLVPGQVREEFEQEICKALEVMQIPCPLNPAGKYFLPQYISATADQIRTLPNINLYFTGATLVIPPQSYFTSLWSPAYQNNLNWYSFAIGSDGYEKSPHGSLSVIIGDVALLGQWVYFDRVNNRVGFAPATDCDLPYQPGISFPLDCPKL